MLSRARFCPQALNLTRSLVVERCADRVSLSCVCVYIYGSLVITASWILSLTFIRLCPYSKCVKEILALK